MYDQNQSSGSAMPPRDTGSSSLSGAGSGAAGTWGTERSQQASSSSIGGQGQFQSETAGHSQDPLGQGSTSTSGGGQATSGGGGGMGDQASSAVDQGIDRAASGLDMAADMIRERGQQMGGGSGAQSSVTMVADKLDAASTYLRDKDSAQLMSDLEGLVRQKPTQSLLIAAGVGFLLSKILR